MKDYPVTREYLALPTIPDRLDFDPQGRPGASWVRDDQHRLLLKYDAVRARTVAALGHEAFKKCGMIHPWTRRAPVLPPTSTRADWYQRQHQARQTLVDLWLAEIARIREDIDHGSPHELFGILTQLRFRDQRYNGSFLHSLATQDIHPLGDGWWYRKVEDVDRSWDRYSKKWHSAHGPAVTVTGRRVEFARMVDGKPERYEARLDSWAGDWLARAVVACQLHPKTRRAPASVCLHQAYDAELVINRHGRRIYRRTLLGRFVDWVAVGPMGTTYHALTRAAALNGLHLKIKRGKHRMEAGLIDWKKCKSLGFCDAGIHSFCSAAELDHRRSYTMEEIFQAVRDHARDTAYFIPELRALAQAVGYPFPKI